jgi:hypothetical protein
VVETHTDDGWSVSLDLLNNLIWITHN